MDAAAAWHTIVGVLPRAKGSWVMAMQTLMRGFRVHATLALVLLTGLYSCSKSEQVTSSAPARRAPTVKVRDSAGLALANMVSAVSEGKFAGDIELKFELQRRPIAGQPVDLDLALIPRADLTRVYATFQASDGLEITQGGKTSEVDHPAIGVPILHTITIAPQHDGVFYVNAVVLADSATQSATRGFSIPVIVGEGISSPAGAQQPKLRTPPPSTQGH